MAVLGAGADAQPVHLTLAEELGRHLAEAGAVVLCGGLGGVMEAAARGAAGAGTLVIGILPGAERLAANPYIHVAVATGLGEARNAVLVRAADACVAVGGGWGTLSEIALARRMGKPVVALATWHLEPPGARDSLFRQASTPAEAAVLALTLAGVAPSPPTGQPAPSAPADYTPAPPPPAPAAGTPGGHPSPGGRAEAGATPAAATPAGTPLRVARTGTPGRPGSWTVTAGDADTLVAAHPDLGQALRLAGVALAGADEPPAAGGFPDNPDGPEIRIGRRLVMSRNVAGGQVRLDGTELPVALVLERLAEVLSADSVAGVREHYPILGRAEVAACLRFAADVLAGLRRR